MEGLLLGKTRGWSAIKRVFNDAIEGGAVVGGEIKSTQSKMRQMVILIKKVSLGVSVLSIN